MSQFLSRAPGGPTAQHNSKAFLKAKLIYVAMFFSGHRTRQAAQKRNTAKIRNSTKQDVKNQRITSTFQDSGYTATNIHIQLLHPGSKDVH